MYRGIPPSAGACHTTDAELKPDCGRAGDKSSTITAIGCWAAAFGVTRTPSSGAGTRFGVGTGVGDGVALDEGAELASGVALGVSLGAAGGDGGTNDGLPLAATWPGSSEAATDGLPRPVSAASPTPTVTARTTRATMARRLPRAGRRRGWVYRWRRWGSMILAVTGAGRATAAGVRNLSR